MPTLISTLLVVPAVLSLMWCWGPPGSALGASSERLVVYSGRAERLIKPVLDEFRARTGIEVELLSSGATELVNRLQAEGPRTPADVFLTNDAGSLERARELQLLQPVAMKEVEEAIPLPLRAPDNTWVGISGRFWILVYNTDHVKPDQIRSILDLGEPRWKNKIAVPNAGSEYLQAGISVIKAVYGDERTQQFLQGLKVNAGTNVYGKSSQIVEAVAKGQVAVGVVNHYYIYRHLAAQPTAPIAPLIPDQFEGGMGAILNVAGVGIVKSSRHLEAAKRLVQFLVSPAGQKLFADLNKEYPLNPEVRPDSGLPQPEKFRAASVSLARLAELREPTMLLIEQIGLR
jgi:iron(III) transport system substrate-binding protein